MCSISLHSLKDDNNLRIFEVGIIKIDFTKHDVAKYADMTNQEIINLGNENDAMIFKQIIEAYKRKKEHG